MREGTPNLKRALALLGTLQSVEAVADATALRLNKATFDALFGGGYAEPQGIDDDLMF